MPTGSARCWLCGRKVGDTAASNTQQFRIEIVSEDVPAKDADLTKTMDQSTIVLWLTLVVVVMGVVLMAPGLGVALAIVSLPAALRTVLSVKRREQRSGQAMSVLGRIAVFFGWFTAFAVALSALAVTFVVASFIAVFFECLSALSGHH